MTPAVDPFIDKLADGLLPDLAGMSAEQQQAYVRDRAKEMIEAAKSKPKQLKAMMKSLNIGPQWVPQTPTLKQKLFLELDCLEVLFGGAAGGAKSSALLMAALQYVDQPKYAAILFRRTYADLALPDALMSRAHEWLSRYRKQGLHWNDKEKTWTFPSGATLTFGYLETENDKYRYQGSSYQFCVERDTPILMGDGSYQPIWTIRPGDRVQTLIGPKRVLRVTCAGQKSVTEVITDKGVRVKVSSLHPMLTAYGWASPQVLRTTQFHASDSTREGLARIHSKSRKPVLCLPSGLSLNAEHGPRTRVENLRLDFDVSLRGGRSGFLTSGGLHQGLLLPELLIVPVVLLEQAIPSKAQDTVAEILLGALARARYGSCASSSAFCYRTESDSRDEQSQSAPIIDLTRTPLQDGAAEPSPACLNKDGLARIPLHSQTALCRYNHPYTNAAVDSSEAVRPSFVCMAPKGEAEVWDLTVEDASHYVTYGGIISQNCGFDELTQFTESQYLYLFSRLRRLEGSNIPLRMRAASNPGGTGAKWVQERFVPDSFTPEMAEDTHVFWKEGIATDGTEVKRAFIPARLNDNPHLDRVEYEQSLNELDAVTREQLLRGDWQIRERGNVYPMWEDGIDGRHVITWSQFESLYECRHIPLHWLGAHAHDPGFEPDPRAAVWNFVAGKNGPLSGDVFCIRELYENRMTVDDFADAVKRAELPYSEARRIQVRIIGHEASSEQATLAQKHQLNYQKVKPDANGGIAQMRHMLRITDTDKPHPFKPHKASCRDSYCTGCLFGRPHFYVIVADDQLVNARDERGMVNFRAEIAAYRYIGGAPTLARGMPKIVPYDFFNHLMDAQRNIAVKWFTRAAPLTTQEVTEEKLPESIKIESISAMPEGDEKHRAILAHDFWSEELTEDQEDLGGHFYLNESLTRSHA